MILGWKFARFEAKLFPFYANIAFSLSIVVSIIIVVTVSSVVFTCIAA
jgi:hypothetical protein